VASTSLILTPKLKEAMRRAGRLISFELPDLGLVEIPIEIRRNLQRFLEYDRTINEFWSDYERGTALAGPFVKAARYSWEQFLLELRKATLVKPELKVGCYGSVQDEQERARRSEKLLALELRSKISNVDLSEWREYMAEELLSSRSRFKSTCDRLVNGLRSKLKKAVVWCGSASPIVSVLRKDDCSLQVRYVVSYLKPPLEALLALARICGLYSITDRAIETGVKKHLQYLSLVISGENLDVARRRWEEMVRSTILGGRGT
jgi:hypothetical protein